MDSAVEVEGLTVSYLDKRVLEGMTLSLPSAKMIGIIGPNGAGKSTFLKALLGLIPMDAGKVRFYGRPLKEMRTQIAYVPQRSEIDWNFPVLVRDVVKMGTYPRKGWFGWSSKEDRDWVMECLGMVGMENLAKRQIGELSGGQQQRVFMARALAQRAQLFFLDEPFVGIDAASEAAILQLLHRLRDEGKTVVVVHHDLGKAREYFDQLLLINGRLLAQGTADEVLQPQKVRQAYQRELLVLS